jgi:predicted ABC-type ATPase
MNNKKFRMFAGPNGSGKTTLIEEISKSFNIGYYINADKIEASLKFKKYLECADFFPKNILQEEWGLFLLKNDTDERFRSIDFKGIQIKENFLVCNQEINSYHAAIIAEFFREKLLLENYTFSFETVMSHESKVEYLRKAKDNRFVTYLYFICTQDPEINVQRIKNRVIKGGHDVEIGKVKTRYFRSLELLHSSFLSADRAYIIDSSNKRRNVILEKRKNEVLLNQLNIPDWVAQYLLDKLKMH